MKDYRAPQLKRKAIVQGHCHHKAIMRLDEEESVMKKMGLDFEVLESGCCGMAGSFGYETDKYDVSIQCGERALLPRVRKASLEAIVMADGFSCREQISQQTNRHALHLAEVIEIAQRPAVHRAPGMYPEKELVARREAGLRRARNRTIAALGGLAVVGLLLATLTRKR